MNGFLEFPESKGAKNIKKLTVFIRGFVEDPSIFFDFTEVERDGIEKKLDEALAVFKNKKISDSKTDLF
jgi:hypothetical protein